MASNYETTKKCPAIAFEGYSYRFDKFVSGHTKKRWRCRTRDCYGCLYTSSGIGNSDSQLRIRHRENSIPDPEGRCIEKVVSDLKSKVRTEIAPITGLYDESAAMLSQTLTTASRFPLFCQLDSSLYRAD